MAIRDKAAAFLSQLNPAMQTVGADIAGRGAGVLQKGANVLADVGDAAFRQGGMMGSMQPSLSGASNMMHAGSQNLMNMGPGGQTALGLGGIGTAAALAAGTAATGIAGAHKKKKERMAGRDLGAQLGVQMPIVY
jgi:hypothetical protein